MRGAALLAVLNRDGRLVGLDVPGIQDFLLQLLVEKHEQVCSGRHPAAERRFGQRSLRPPRKITLDKVLLHYFVSTIFCVKVPDSVRS